MVRVLFLSKKTNTQENTDTYTITFNDETTSTFTVTNGIDGYSPQVSVQQEADGVTISVTDNEGTTKAKVLNGTNGRDGTNGKSAYEIAVENGFEGTEEEWLQSLDYEHSDEFTQLATQVRTDAEQSAQNAQSASQSASESATSAQNSLNSANKAKEEADKAQSIADTLDPIKFAVKENADGNPTIISDSADWRLQKFNIYGQSSQDGTPSVENPIPVISKEVSEIKVTGKNLFDFLTLAGGEGATFERNGLSARIENGYLITTGTAINDDYTNILFVSVPTEKRTIFNPGTYTIGKGDKNMSSLTIGISTVSGINLGNKSNTFTIEEPFIFECFYIAYALGQNSNGEKIPLMMVNGNESINEYEPYKEQIIDLTSPITMRGIPANNDGNITIDGQQYVSDVICEKDGSIGVERNVIDLSPSDGIVFKQTPDNPNRTVASRVFEVSTLPKNGGNKSLSTHFVWIAWGGADNNKEWIFSISEKSIHISPPAKEVDYTKEEIESLVNDEWTKIKNDVKFSAQLSKPTFEPLPEEIQEQYKALKSYYPNTVIQTGCWNEVTYVADTELYIEKKLSEISSQLTELKADTLLLGGM